MLGLQPKKTFKEKLSSKFGGSKTSVPPSQFSSGAMLENAGGAPHGKLDHLSQKVGHFAKGARYMFSSSSVLILLYIEKNGNVAM